jgi:PAS domain S-box-containing protein
MNTHEPVNILMVDDQPGKLLSYEAILGPLREKLVKANSGREALEYLLKTDIAVVLMDVSMPDIDGFQLADMIREHPRFQKTAIIFISAVHLSDLDRIKGYERGAVDYISVPVIPELLRAKVSVFAELYRKTQQLEKLNRELEQRVAERTEELRESESQFRSLANSIPQLAWMANPDGSVFWYNQRWYDYTGTTLEEVSGWGWKSLVHADHVTQVVAGIERSWAAGEPWEETFRLRGKDGSYRWFLSRALPIHDVSGKVVRWFGTNTDITERLKADEQRVLLINELNHRVKNTLATVQSLAMQTLRNTERSADARDLFESRLTALSRAHDVLTVESWEGAELRRVASRALEPFTSKDGRVSIEGPDVWLTPKQALALSMTLHELATNATKYGALSNDAGTVQVSWVVALLDGTGELTLTWSEQGGPPVSPPTRKGFGTRLIQPNLAHDLGGGATIDYRPQGVVSVIRSPIEKHHQGSHQ